MREKIKIALVVAAKIIVTVAMCWMQTSRVHAQTIDSAKYWKGKLDTANYELYMSNQQVNAVKFYIKCVKNKPKNQKFFWNWITTRAMVPHPVYEDTPPKSAVTTKKQPVSGSKGSH